MNKKAQRKKSFGTYNMMRISKCKYIVYLISNFVDFILEFSIHIYIKGMSNYI